MKRTKKFNQEWAEAIALLPYTLQASITDAIRSYQNEGIVPEGLHPLAQALFIVIRPTIDARARRSAYQKERRQRRKTSCLRTVAQDITETRPKATEKPNSSKAITGTPEHLPQKVLQMPEQPIKKIVQSTPQQSNRFLRQVEKARRRVRHNV